MNSLCESLMVFIHPESVVVDKTAGDSLKKYTLSELVSLTCADDVVIAMLADVTVLAFILFPDILGNADSVVMLDGAMAKSRYVNVEQFSSVRKLTLKIPNSKYDRAAMTIDTPTITAIPPENGCRPSPGTIVTGS